MSAKWYFCNTIDLLPKEGSRIQRRLKQHGDADADVGFAPAEFGVGG